jgi:membrane-bound ClpP family serine protease
LTIGHRFLKRRVQMSMQQHSDTLVGQKAMVVEDLRPRGIGSIRAMLTPEEEAARSMKREQADDPLKIFPAVADQYISKGRIVRVTGGDRTMYRVRPIRW